jgi:hypothetical protein
MTEPAMRLDLFTNPKFDRGASCMTETLWMLAQAPLFASWLPGSGWRVRLLRAYLSRVSYRSRLNKLPMNWDGILTPSCKTDLVLVQVSQVSCPWSGARS